MSVLSALKANEAKANISYIIFEIKEKWFKLQAQNTSIKFLWIPAHKGVFGNEVADKLAKSAATPTHASNDRSETFMLPHSDVNHSLKLRMYTEWQHLYNSAVENGKGLWYANINNNVIGNIFHERKSFQ